MASPRRFKISFTFGGMVAVSKDRLLNECCNFPRPLPFVIYYIFNLDIYFYAILIILIFGKTLIVFPDAFVLPVNEIEPFAAVIDK